MIKKRLESQVHIQSHYFRFAKLANLICLIAINLSSSQEQNYFTFIKTLMLENKQTSMAKGIICKQYNYFE